MNPSQDQINSAIRTFISAGGGAVAGWAIAKGWVTQEQAMAVLSNEQFMGTATALLLAVLGSLASALSGIWGLVIHKQANHGRHGREDARGRGG